MSVRVKIRDNPIYDAKYEDVWSELWLRPGAPRIVVDAAYRALSRQYHPDLGEEDLRAQVRLNEAYKQLKGMSE